MKSNKCLKLSFVLKVNTVGVKSLIMQPQVFRVCVSMCVYHMLFSSGCPIFTAGLSAGSNSLPLIIGLICFNSAALTARVSGYSTAAQGDRLYARVHTYMYIRM